MGSLRLSWVLLCASLQACTGERTASVSEPLRILPLGDSITQGRRGHPPKDPPTQSWRYPLWRALLGAGVQFDLVGGSRSAFEGDPLWPPVNGIAFDADHESRWGWRLDQVTELLRTDLPRLSFDAVLVILGGNDLGQGQSLDSLWPDWEALLQLLRAKNPNVAVVIGQYCQDFDPVDTLYAAGLQRMAKMQSRPRSPVVVVSGCDGWISDPSQPGTHTVDWVHPNALGDEKLSTAFLRALKQLFPKRFPGARPPHL